VVVPELGLEYEVEGAAPVQALGTIRGREFYFRARHSNWTFEVANDLGELPTDVGGDALFYLQSRHNDASFLSLDEACVIIEHCAKSFLELTWPNLKTLGS
jgi:hypothetical protein